MEDDVRLQPFDQPGGLLALDIQGVQNRVFGQVVPVSRRKVVDHVNFGALSEQRFGQMGADKAGTAGDEHFHDTFPSFICSRNQSIDSFSPSSRETEGS